MLPAIAAAVHAAAAAAAAALPSVGPALAAAAPVAAAGLVGIGLIAAHKPELDPVTLTGSPEVALQCVERRIASQPGDLVAVAQPLYGAATYSVVVKRGGVTGDPVVSGIVQQTATGSSVEFRALTPGSPDAAAIAEMVAGC